MAYDFIKDEEELRKIYRTPGKLAEGKVINYVDDHCRAFIAASPFLVMASSNDKGRVDSSPRGGVPGFVRVINDKYLLMADWPGNNRLDSLCNILEHPRVGMLFFIPGVEETLRVNGEARITTSPDLLERVPNAAGRPPKTALYIEIHAMYLHCAMSLKSAGVWKPETWDTERKLESAQTIWNDHIALNSEPTS